MKITELRIGNLIQKNDDICVLASINTDSTIRIFNDDKTDTYGCFCFRIFEPIPITEEWLLKFGFVKSNLDGDNAWLNLKYRFLNFSSDESVNFEKVYLTVNKMDIICSYVHELQNLYFALTQAELHAN